MHNTLIIPGGNPYDPSHYTVVRNGKRIRVLAQDLNLPEGHSFEEAVKRTHNHLDQMFSEEHEVLFQRVE